VSAGSSEGKTVIKSMLQATVGPRGVFREALALLIALVLVSLVYWWS
jgi:hypothetical protein